MEPNETQVLIQIKQRRLQILHVQQAGYGPLATPPHITIEIEQLEAELARLRAQSRHGIIRTLTLDTERPPRMAGLIALVSPERPDQRIAEQAAFDAIDYHRAALRRCWLIASGGEGGSLPAAHALRQFCEQRAIGASVWQVEDALSIAETYNVVDWLYTYDLAAHQLAETDVIADITGANKPMTVGMLLACRGRRPVQYMARQAHGPSQPLLLQLSLPAGPPTAPQGRP